jgi:hypothetical protein
MLFLAAYWASSNQHIQIFLAISANCINMKAVIINSCPCVCLVNTRTTILVVRINVLVIRAPNGQLFRAISAPACPCTESDIVDFCVWFKLTWLVLGEDPAARSHRVEQFTAL